MRNCKIALSRDFPYRKHVFNPVMQGKINYWEEGVFPVFLRGNKQQKPCLAAFKAVYKIRQALQTLSCIHPTNKISLPLMQGFLSISREAKTGNHSGKATIGPFK